MGTKGSSSLWRRKQVHHTRHGDIELAKHLRIADLVSIGIGSTVGAGVYVLVGTVARERAGPALTISFLIAGIAAALAALCYAELSSRCPSAGSAYHYAYTCVGEGVAWIIGWGLILEYTVGGSTVARGIAPNLGVFVGGEENLPWLLIRRTIPSTEIIVDPCAAFLVIIVTALLCVGIRESARVQAAMVVLNVLVLLFVAGAGSYAGSKNGWKGYEQPDGYMPYGINGVLGGAATLFFAYIGFDTVASTAEEVKNPQRDLPLGIALALFICGGLYILVSGVIVGLVPYNLMDPDTPMSTAFAENGMPWATYVVAAGAVAALATTLMGSLLPQPRILMAMARDGLLPPFFSTVHPKTSVPVNGTILAGAVAAIMAFMMNVDELSGMVSVGTLLAFTIVSVCLLVLRYIPPPDTSKPVFPSRTSEGLPVVPKSPSRPIFTSQYPIFSPVLTILSEASLHSLPGRSTYGDYASSASSIGSPLQDETEELEEETRVFEIPPSYSREDLQNPLLMLEQPTNLSEASREEGRRHAAGLAILGVLIGVILISLATAATALPALLRWGLGSLGIPLFIAASTILCLIEQDDGQHKFGQPGGAYFTTKTNLPFISYLML
uniref:Cationic amino acid transporter C-terminal domain-containing protein n=1 Tax=Physcomitrium patens TaxID=3218 RepID=A0A7I4D6P2_PHYPA